MYLFNTVRHPSRSSTSRKDCSSVAVVVEVSCPKLSLVLNHCLFVQWNE